MDAERLMAVVKILLSLLWAAVRLPLLMVLGLLEPFVTFFCCSISLLGLLMTLFFVAIGLPHFPAWTMLALSLGFLFVLAPYYYLIERLGR